MAKLLVASEFIDSESKETTPVRNPATPGRSIGTQRYSCRHSSRY